MKQRGITKRAVLTIRKLDPARKAAVIARDLDVSRERIRQILKGLELPTAIYQPTPICQDCGKELRKRNNNHQRCIDCWREVHIIQAITLQCDECGRTFTRPLYLHKRAMESGYRHIWCSKQCQGHWLGSHFGRAKHTPIRVFEEAK